MTSAIPMHFLNREGYDSHEPFEVGELIFCWNRSEDNDRFDLGTGEVTSEVKNVTCKNCLDLMAEDTKKLEQWTRAELKSVRARVRQLEDDYGSSRVWSIARGMHDLANDIEKFRADNKWDTSF